MGKCDSKANFLLTDEPDIAIRDKDFKAILGCGHSSVVELNMSFKKWHNYS